MIEFHCYFGRTKREKRRRETSTDTDRQENKTQGTREYDMRQKEVMRDEEDTH